MTSSSKKIADSRGVISSFVTSVMVSRHWGTGHFPTVTSITITAKTMRQSNAWMHPDHFSTFTMRPKDHQGLFFHNGFLIIPQAVAHLKTHLLSGGSARGIVANMHFPKGQKEYVLRPNGASYISAWGTMERRASETSPIFRKPARVLPGVPLIMWKSKTAATTLRRLHLNARCPLHTRRP